MGYSKYSYMYKDFWLRHPMFRHPVPLLSGVDRVELTSWRRDAEWSLSLARPEVVVGLVQAAWSGDRSSSVNHLSIPV